MPPSTTVHEGNSISKVRPDPKISSVPQSSTLPNPTPTPLQPPCAFNFRWHDANDHLVPTPHTMWTRRIDPLPAPDCTVYPILPPPPLPPMSTAQLQTQLGRQVSNSPTPQLTAVQLPPCQQQRQPPHFQPTA
ncbi:unnamed protein product, partial [Dibothriocephalus latus]